MRKSIVVEKLTKKYNEHTAVDNITFDVLPGEIFGFLGANGAGKTTTIKMLNGTLQPSSGIAIVAGFDVYSEREKIKKKIGYLNQHHSLYDNLTLAENIQFFGGIYGLKNSEIKKRGNRILEELELLPKRHHRTSTLAPGEKRKLAFCVSVLHTPTILFLDEPTASVDPATRRKLWELIYTAAENGMTILVSTHYMDEAEYCDRISIMCGGKIKALDTPKGLKLSHQSDSMDEIFTNLTK